MTATELYEFQEKIHAKELSHAQSMGLCSSGDEPIYDGICDINGYLESPIKIMWILKEAWEKREGEEALGGWYIWEPWSNPAEMNSMWKTMMHVMYGITTGIQYEQMPVTNDEMLGLLKSCAYININKMPSRTTSGTMKKSYEQWREILLEQISGYNPDVIIFGNTYDGLFEKEEFAINSKSRQDLGIPGIVGAYISGERLLVDAWHPSPLRICSKPDITDDVYVDSIVKAVRGYKNS